MSLPTVYDETSLAVLMHTMLGAVGGFLGYPQPTVDAGIFAEEVNQVLLECGLDELSAASDLKQLRALAGLFAWRKACADLSAQYDFMVEGNHYQRGQVFEHAANALMRAETDALPYREEYQVFQAVPWSAFCADPFDLG